MDLESSLSFLCSYTSLVIVPCMFSTCRIFDLFDSIMIVPWVIKVTSAVLLTFFKLSS